MIGERNVSQKPDEVLRHMLVIAVWIRSLQVCKSMHYVLESNIVGVFLNDVQTSPYELR